MSTSVQPTRTGQATSVAATGQTELPLYKVAPDDASVAWLEHFLREHREWITAGQISPLVEKDERWIRAVAESSSWIISGQKGYKHIEHATAEEIGHFVNWMESQGKKMIGRAERVKRNAHAVFG